MTISIRVLAKTEDQQRVITVADNGSSFACNCDGFNGLICSHIDAVLIAQERAMVHPDDWPLADQAVNLVSRHIVVPDDWKGSWRKNLVWRGLSNSRVRDGSKPLVCFTGTLDRPRPLLKKEAESLGWETIDSPSPFTDVLVAADPLGTSGKLNAARKNGTPIITSEEWSILLTDGVLPS